MDMIIFYTIPKPAETTLPKITSSTTSLAIPACLIADSTAIPPSCVADNPLSDDWKDPIGVLVAETITTSLNLLELQNRTFLMVDFNADFIERAMIIIFYKKNH